ncbi:PREDICTED: E3 SUMO-ligase RanBP2 [Prunus dulcis]|uniref:PREDICTED: E3 SUMO-ligase RanBP2 n=1 Tax=Prunus dulcis TaxID=3755 RepID=A0A5E4GDD7_PRUDU|nr:nuclear pore complex protein NUP50A-like [Prunus dulcis]VVA37746.1 PREDICTED: E3 SUMO-ligase RanBP2 [Prunus dulcis]
MADSENALPPSKKRAAGRELSRDNPGLDDEEDALEQETGTFKRASEEVLATRRIVKVRRQQPASGPTSNPFAGIQLVPPTEGSAVPAEVTAAAQPASEIRVSDEENKQSESKVEQVGAESAADKENVVKENTEVSSEATEPEVVHEPAVGENKTNEGETENEEKTENEDNKDNKNENVDPSPEGTSLSSFQQLSSSQNAFTNLSGTGFSTSTFSFGLISKDGSTLGTGSGSLFGSNNDQPSGLGLSNNGNSSKFGTSGAPVVPKSDGGGFPPMQEVPVETGEENEKAVFNADAALFEFIDGGWKERGKGDLKVNVSESGTEKARLVMRLKGIRKVILNASLYPDMKLTNMEKKGVTFACMNSIDEKKDGLSTFALKFKDGSIVEEFRTAVTAHKDKGKASTAMKTPENSPKASDD